MPAKYPNLDFISKKHEVLFFDKKKHEVLEYCWIFLMAGPFIFFYSSDSILSRIQKSSKTMMKTNCRFCSCSVIAILFPEKNW